MATVYMARHTLICTGGQLVTVSSHGTEEEAVLVCAVARSEVVEVEDPDLEDSVVGTDTEVGNSDDGG